MVAQSEGTEEDAERGSEDGMVCVAEGLDPKVSPPHCRGSHSSQQITVEWSVGFENTSSLSRKSSWSLRWGLS